MSSSAADGLIFVQKGSPITERWPQVAFDDATHEEKFQMAHAARKHAEKTEDEKRAMTWARHMRRKKAKRASRSPPNDDGDGDGSSMDDGDGDGRLAQELAEKLRPPGHDDRAVAQPKQLQGAERFSPPPRVMAPPANSMAKSMARPSRVEKAAPVQKAAPVHKVDHNAATAPGLMGPGAKQIIPGHVP